MRRQHDRAFSATTAATTVTDARTMGKAFVIFRNEAQSQLAELRVRFSLRRLPNSLHFNASAATSCVLDDIWGGESARVSVDTPFNVTLRRRQTFFFTVSNCSSGLQL